MTVPKLPRPTRCVSVVAATLALALGLGPTPGLQAQEWKPTRAVEFVVPSGPGAALDTAARQVAGLLERQKLIDGTVVVANRSGGAGTIAIQTLLQHPGDPHWLATFTTGMINARAIGEVASNYTEVTPIAVLLEESIVVAVRADSPVRTGADLTARLRKEPDALAIGIATSVGNHIHVGVAMPLKAAGVEVSRLRMVPFRSSADSMTALLGGHIDVVSASTPHVIGQLQAGKIRVLGVATAERLPGPLSSVPTWTEQGIPAVYSSVQGVLAPPGLNPAQIRFWQDALRKVSETDEWKTFLARQNWRPKFMDAQAMKAYIAGEYDTTKSLLDELKVTRK